MRYLLKVFSGPHVGAEALLAEGETIIGSGDDCDIVLDDRLIAQRHAAICVTGDAIECGPLGDNTLLINGKPSAKTVIRPFQFFTIGATHLAIGPADEPWPHFDLTDFQLRSPVEERLETPESAAQPKAGGKDAEDTAQRSGGPQSTREGLRLRKFALRSGAVLATVLILLNALLLLVFCNSLGSGEPAAVEAESGQMRLQRAIGPYVPHVALESNNNRLELTGYVVTEHDRDALLKAARDADPNVMFKVRSTESLLASVQSLLKRDGWTPALQAVAAGPGVVRIAGTLPLDGPEARRRWHLTESRIEEDVPLKTLVVEFDELGQDQRLAADSHGAHLRSLVPPANPGSLLGLRGNPLPILDVRVSHDKVVTLVDGRQVSIGGRLPDGSRVEEIDLHHAVVRTTGGQRLVIPYGIGG